MNRESYNTKDIAASIIARIKSEGITPTPRWHFLMKEGVVWSLGALSVALGSMAVAGILFEIRNAWWDVYDATHSTFVDFLLDAVPFMWFLIFGLFVVTAYLFVRQTKGGYRYRFFILVGISLAASGVGGTLLYVTGAGAFVDEEVGAYVPMHHPLVERERVMWSVPGKGLIAGVVRELSYTEPVMWIENFDGEPYELALSSFSLKDRNLLHVGDVVRVIGIPSTTTPHTLQGCLIFILSDDVLQHAPMKSKHGQMEIHQQGASHERNVIVARSTECRDVRPYTRFLPLTQ